MGEGAHDGEEDSQRSLAGNGADAAGDWVVSSESQDEDDGQSAKEPPDKESLQPDSLEVEEAVHGEVVVGIEEEVQEDTHRSQAGGSSEEQVEERGGAQEGDAVEEVVEVEEHQQQTLPLEDLEGRLHDVPLLRDQVQEPSHQQEAALHHQHHIEVVCKGRVKAQGSNPSVVHVHLVVRDELLVVVPHDGFQVNQ